MATTSYLTLQLGGSLFPAITLSSRLSRDHSSHISQPDENTIFPSQETYPCGTSVLRNTYFAEHLFCGTPILRDTYFAEHLFCGIPLLGAPAVSYPSCDISFPQHYNLCPPIQTTCVLAVLPVPPTAM